MNSAASLARRRRRPAAVAMAFVVSGLTAGCGGQRPSRVPLGFGPIAESMRNDPPPPRKAAPEREPPSGEQTASNDADTESEDETPATTEEPKKDEPQSTTAKDEPPSKSDASAALTAAAFVGNYEGEDVSAYRLEGSPDREDRDPNAKIDAKSDDEHSADFVLIDSSNGQEICTLTSSTKGNTATIARGQKCFEQDEGDESASATVKTGTVTIDQAKLKMDVSFDFKMSVADRDFEGTLDYHFEGTRK